VVDAVTDLPSPVLYAGVVGQERVVEQLLRAASHPVHAYLFTGPPGTGKRQAALGLAASVLCPNGGDGTCPVCVRVLAGTHIDVVVMERSGAYIRVEEAREIARLASLTPVDGTRKVLILNDFHLVEDAAPALLKTIEEPPASALFIVLADHVPPELVTIASRCVRLEFRALSEEVVRTALEDDGVAHDVAVEAARAAGGRLDRARLLAADPDVAARRAAWEAVPGRLDGTGATVAVVADELLALVQRAGGDSLAKRHAAELEAMQERVALTGERPTARKEMDARHRREQRRLRTDELRWGLATLAGAYRDRAARGHSPRDVAPALAATSAIQEAAEALIRNPNETLLLQALLVRIQPPR
jgi:DNA polymerase-3 subunit delta'